MPWVHFHVADKGVVKACCVAQIPLGNVNTDSYASIWNGKPIQVLREKFLSSEPDSRCKVCINQELAGAKSIRQETWDKFKTLSEFPIIQDDFPTYFDIRFSNVCNFRCRTCWQGASSKWHSEAVQLGRTKSKQAILLNINHFESFILEYGPALKQAKEIYFAGGEPLITEAHYQLLEWLILNGNHTCRLRYNTNFSTLKFKGYDLIALWQRFENIEIMASIDASDELGEYIRKDMNWETILKNRELIRNESHIHFKVSPTVSILSIYHLPDLYQTLLEKNMIAESDFYFNILDRPRYYNIKAFKPEQKHEISTKYNRFYHWAAQHSVPKEIINGFKSCINFMNTEDLSNQWSKFLKETAQIDQIRTENLMSWWFNALKLNE